MASTISIARSAGQAQETALSGIHRSRFSFHFNTARRRRWLLVQIVTTPSEAQEDTTEALYHNRPTQPTIGRLMDDYCSSSSLRRWV